MRLSSSTVAKPRPKRTQNRRRTAPKRRNQRQLLEVNVRAQKAIQQRNRWCFTIFCKVILLAAVCGGLYFGGCRAVNELFYANPDYALQRLNVATDGTLSREEMIVAAGVAKGGNLFSIDLRQVRQNLEELPQVHSATVERILPDVLTILIEERKPVAWLTASATTDDPFTSPDSFLIDSRGVLLAADKLLPEYMHLPIISGLATNEFMVGQAMKLYELRAALDLLRLSDSLAYPMNYGVRMIDLSKGYCMMVTDSRRARIVFAFENLAEQLERMNSINGYASEQGLDVATANLMLKRNIPVTMLPSVAALTDGVSDPTTMPRVLKAIPVTH